MHQLWPPREDKQSTEMDVVLFHGLQLTANDNGDAWRGTCTQRGHDDVCCSEEWLPIDLGEAVHIFSASYNAHVLESSPHGHVSHIANNVYQTLINPRYKSLSLIVKMPCLGKCSGFTHKYIKLLKFSDLRFVTQSLVISQLYRKFVHLSVIVYEPTVDGVSTLPEN